MKTTKNYKKETYKGLIIETINSEWGWYINLSDGYESDYFETKKEVNSRVKEIKNEIKKGTW